MLRTRPNACAIAVALSTLASCGGGGGRPAGSTGGALDRGTRLSVISQQPAESAVQVALDASLSITCDGVIALDCLTDPANGLFLADAGTRVECTLSLDHGRRILFAPIAALTPETDYELRLSPLVCDVDGRLLDDDFIVPFRTLDLTPPNWVGLVPSDGHPVQHGESIVLRADERLDPISVTPSTVSLRDGSGRIVAATLACDGTDILLTPLADLPGDAEWSVWVRGVRDRAGNRQGASTSIRFRSAPDRDGPRLLRSWPEQHAQVSPFARVELVFDESVAVPTDAAAPILTDERGGVFPVDYVLSKDQRTLAFVPLAPLTVGVTYEIRSEQDAGLLDVSGNAYAFPVILSFSVCDDTTPPAIVAIRPRQGSDRIDPRAVVTLVFDEPLDPQSLALDGVSIEVDGNAIPLASLALETDPTRVVAIPAVPLPVMSTIVVRAHADGRVFRDLVGNVLATDRTFSFTTSDDPDPMRVLVWPEPATVGLPFDATLALLADAPLNPETVDATRIEVLDTGLDPVSGVLTLEREDRVVRFTPSGAWMPGASYTLVVHGGPDGLRKLSGNWLETDLRQQFRVGFRSDADPPDLEVTVNAIGAPRNQLRSVPRAGATLDFRARVGTDPALDLTSAQLVLEGPAPLPSPEVLFARARITSRSLQVDLRGDLALLPGHYILHGRVHDLSGGSGEAPPLEFDVVETGPAELPFDRTQVVRVRFDLDRDENGRSDFEDDLLRVGLIAPGDPLGSNQRMIDILRAGVLAEAHRIFGRRADGAPLGPESVPLRLTAGEARGIVSMQIACGGLDPEGARDRHFGDDSTGVLGRARYDFRNKFINDLAIATTPGLGVFPAELFLFESRVHLDVYPGYVTGFARRFMPLVAELGGTSAGNHALDAAVLAPDFDPSTATSAQRARYITVFAAADDWAACVGTILAHEIGHAVGLVAPGSSGSGLHGDVSLHNEFAGPGDVMAAAIGFDAMTAIPFAFRDLNLAYLRQRVILR